MAAILARSASARVAVWDRFVRVCHWSLVGCFLGATLLPGDGDRFHRMLGYAALALVGGRLLWGLVGSRYARFSEFLPQPKELLGYLRSLWHRRERRYLGHNPAGAVMILMLLLGVTGCGVSGWLLTTDRYWGDEFMEALHEGLAYGTLGLVLVHLSGVLYASWRHRENLVWSMIVGTKPD